jgi:hypothetical protein
MHVLWRQKKVNKNRHNKMETAWRKRNTPFTRCPTRAPRRSDGACRVVDAILFVLYDDRVNEWSVGKKWLSGPGQPRSVIQACLLLSLPPFVPLLPLPPRSSPLPPAPIPSFPFLPPPFPSYPLYPPRHRS